MIFQREDVMQTKAIELQNIVDFDVPESPLTRSPLLAAWLGIEECWLKDETVLPTGTFKDRITEVLFSFFYKNGITTYAHCSTGNTGTSLAWGVQQFMRLTGKKFHQVLFVAEEQLPYHAIPEDQNIEVVVLEGAGYQETKQYCAWYTNNILKLPDYMNFKSELRQQGNTVGYLEAFQQLFINGGEVTAVVQAISDGSGLNGGYRASQIARENGWIENTPKFYAFQPAADPMVRCFQAGHDTYQDECSLEHLAPSRAVYIRRKDGRGSYDMLAHFVNETRGTMESVSEAELVEAQKELKKLTGIEAGYTACVSLAGIKKLVKKGKIEPSEKFLVYLTGKDRPKVSYHQSRYVRVPQDEWRKVLESREQLLNI